MGELHQAAKTGTASEVEALLRAGHDPNGLDDAGQPPLRYVLSYGIGFVLEKETELVIRALLAAGADPNLANVGRVLVDEADSMVCSASEAMQAIALARMLGQHG